MSSDSKYFNCSQESEHNYVAGLYSVSVRPAVRKFLSESCEDGSIKYSTHAEVYALIKEKLGYEREA